PAVKTVEIREDTVLDPSRQYGQIEIKASGITVDGKGAWLIGDRHGRPNTFQGSAITAEGVSHVTLKNLNAKGWETGLRISNGSEWAIENCDFSDNFHDPDLGWGEHGRRGGMVLTKVHNSVVRNCKANRVWDACVLVDSNDNRLEASNFSHASDTCLKLWSS